MSYDSSILGLDCSRFMIHESGSMFDLRAEGNSLTPPRDRVSKSLLDASATMATTDLVGPAIGSVAFASVMLCVVGWKRGWCYTEGESGAMAVASTAIGVPAGRQRAS